MAHICREVLFKDELAWIIENEIGIEVDDDENLNAVISMFYQVRPVHSRPEGAIVTNNKTLERYIVPDFYL